MAGVTDPLPSPPGSSATEAAGQPAGRLQTALAVQRAAFAASLPVSAAVRRDRLQRALDLLRTHQEPLAKALSADYGHRSLRMSLVSDILSSVKPLEHALANVDRWMKPETRGVDFPLRLLGGSARVEFQPKGVVGVVSPWNFPVALTFAPLAGILAAGNRTMIKPSEFTPRTSELMAQLIAERFDAAELRVFPGDADLGKAFVALPFDHLLFTGATTVGRHVLRAAAENLVPVTLELGGKSPVLIGRSADLRAATERIAMGKMLNAGQACIAPDYVLVPREMESAVIAGLEQAVAAMYPTLLANDDYTAIVNARHRARLQGLIDDAVRLGAEVIEVNPAGEAFSADSPKLPLRLLRGVTGEMRVMREEIFGPILPIKSYQNLDDAIRLINAGDRPLALYYFGADGAEQRQVLDQTIAGGVTINDVMFHYAMEDLPFGGVGPSGMGGYHGQDGFRTFSHAKSIYRQPRWDIAGLAGFKPPYGAKLEKVLTRALRLPRGH